MLPAKPEEEFNCTILIAVIHKMSLSKVTEPLVIALMHKGDKIQIPFIKDFV